MRTSAKGMHRLLQVTSRWLLETGLCLALQDDALKGRSDVLHGGVLTPAAAGGAVLMERLRAMGTQFNVLEEH